jgi:CheY-like chemotaxis protein
MQAENPKVLLVDDDQDFVSDLEMWLTKLGFCAHVAQLGQAAIQHYRMYRPYDAVILDLHMPKVDGLQVLTEIKREDATAKVAVLTADAAARENAMAMGADAFLVKPVGRKAICRLLGRLVCAS